jgi:hypothetical protein
MANNKENVFLLVFTEKILCYTLLVNYSEYINTVEKSLYFIAYIEPEDALLFTALLKSVEDNMAFDRGMQNQKNMYEFFVPIASKDLFIEYMNLFEQKGLIKWWKLN